MKFVPMYSTKKCIRKMYYNLTDMWSSSTLNALGGKEP